MPGQWGWHESVGRSGTLSAVPTSVLSDGTIRRLVAEGRIVIDPWEPGRVQPASVDLLLGDSFRVFHNHRVAGIDLKEPPQGLTEEVTIKDEESFVIHPGEFCLGRTLEWVELPDDVVARIEGKALALDTPVPTPAGWTTMGELEIGDLVFGADGEPIPIIDVSDVLEGRECREVLFSDGTAIVADLDHQWEVLTRTDRSRGLPTRIRTTREIEQTLECGAKEYNHHVIQAAPVRYAARRLHVDPLRPTGRRLLHRIGATGHTRDPDTGRYARSDSLSIRLRNLGVLGDKHVPGEHLRAGVEQRRALLEGIVETFTPHAPVFRMPRKLARQRCGGRFYMKRAIVDVQPVPSVPVRCIQVGSPRGVYLVSPGFIPTHNSSLGRLGLIVHATAGFIDPGWKGTLTLELNNLTRVPIRLHPGLPIAQLSFMALDAPAERPYGSEKLGSHYQGQVAATESRYMR
jgi:deoxycytidine triphosphate deaminase